MPLMDFQVEQTTVSHQTGLTDLHACMLTLIYCINTLPYTMVANNNCNHVVAKMDVPMI